MGKRKIINQAINVAKQRHIETAKISAQKIKNYPNRLAAVRTFFDIFLLFDKKILILFSFTQNFYNFVAVILKNHGFICSISLLNWYLEREERAILIRFETTPIERRLPHSVLEAVPSLAENMAGLRFLYKLRRIPNEVEVIIN